MNAFGDSHREKEGGMAGELDETLGRAVKEEVRAIGLLKLHDFCFDSMLTLLQTKAGSG